MTARPTSPFHLTAATVLAAAAALASAGDAHAQLASAARAAEELPTSPPSVNAGTFSALRARSIGPGLKSGRISDIAVHPGNHAEWYVAVASGGVWKTENHGTTFTPIFDRQESYSIGCVTICPHHHDTVWVGTGENNGQRSVSWGDGVYRSDDGGRSWRNVGLEDSGHIGMITVHPDDPDVVYVAAQGPLWSSGGDRGVYRTVDGGETWERILHVDDDTGANEVHLDPRDPGVLYATTWQRRRHVWTMINGGPGSGIWKSEDGGDTWRELVRGIPRGDKGKIGLDLAPADPDVLYAVLEAKDGQSGIFRSTNRGENWQRRSSYTSSAPFYYNEIVCDPLDVDRAYLLNTFLMRTEDGGRNWDSIQGRNQHVDHHALWIHPTNTSYFVSGTDGGLYTTYDDGSSWEHYENLPVTQFYRVAVDTREPFYFIYGGTQDNNTLGGPSRTLRRNIDNEDWFVTVGGDGFESQVDPTNPDLVYSQWQYGGLVRHDRKTGENVDIKPRPRPGQEPFVFNWDAPLLISPHDHRRVYFAGRRLHRSDDRGDSWRQVSPDLTRGIDRNTLEVMGRVWPVDAVAKHRSTSIYGNIVSLDESPLVEGLLYVGTDDGLVHVTEDGGETWRPIDAFPAVPHMTYVSCLRASRHDADTVYAAFDNHKQGDFTPYLLVSRDRGATWTNLGDGLPERDVVYGIVEDHVRPGLLFVGTEFGAYYSLDGGATWTKIAGLPTIAVQDVEIQRRENDLVMATFGRGFYIVDDYSPLQTATRERMGADAHVFPVRDALFYIPSSKGRGSQGDGRWTANNPPFGALVTWHLKDSVRTGPRLDSNATHPEYEKLRERARTRSNAVWLEITGEDGEVVARLSGPTSAGVHRTAWNLRHEDGPYVLPGAYRVQVMRRTGDEVTALGAPGEIVVRHLAAGTIQPEDREAVHAFHRDVVALSSAVNAARRTISSLEQDLAGVERAVMNSVEADGNAHELGARAHALSVRLMDLREAIDGDRLPGEFQEPTVPGIRSRVGWATASWRMTAPPTGTQRDAYADAKEAFADVHEALVEIAEELWPELQADLDDADVQWTPGRPLPDGERD